MFVQPVMSDDKALYREGVYDMQSGEGDVHIW